MTVDEFLDKLEGVRPSGGGYVCVCPSHEDRNASLSVTEGEDGKIVVHCHAGCTASEIVAGMELQLRDLFPVIAVVGEPEAVYQYTDEQGNVLYENLRMPGKRFRQRHFDPDSPDAKPDGWVYNLDDVRRVPYRLPELIAGVLSGRGVWIVEGEKDVESMMAAGSVATSSKNWREEWCKYLTGARVTIVADRDETGRAQANKVREMLTPFTGAVRILQAKEGKDATDHLAAGLGLADFVPVRSGPRRGIVTAQQMVEAARESLNTSELDAPGYRMLDDCPIIFRQGRMYALGAYTSDGKTRMALQVTRKLAMNGVRVAYYSLEMPEADLRNILISHRGVPLRLLEEPWRLKQEPEMYEKFELALAEMSDWHLDIIFNTKVNADYVVQTSNDREHDFIIVDHVHRFAWGGERRGLESEVQKLTNLALESNIPVFLLCQLRKVSRGKDLIAYPNPTLQEFRETSIIGDDASIAMSLWRQRDPSGMKFVGDVSNLTILKNRHTTGRQDAAGSIFFPRFDIQTQLFSLAGGVPVEKKESDGDDLGVSDEEEPSEFGGLYDD